MKNYIINNNLNIKIKINNNLKILIITPFCTRYIKDFTWTLSNYVSNITVLVHHNYLSEFARYVPLSYFHYVEKYSKKNLVDLKNKPYNVNVHIISILYFIPDSRNYRLGDKLAKLFEKYINKNNIDFDLIHAHFTWPSGYAGVKLAEKFDIPVVITAHGHDIYDLPFRKNIWLNKIKWVLLNADHIITVSKWNFKILTEKLSVSPDRISVIPNGFDPRLFRILSKKEARTKLGLPLNKKIILNVANLVPIKGQKYLIQAMKLVHEQKENVMLYIVGDGSLKNELEKCIKKFGLQNVVKLVGERPHEEIPLWMNAADLFVLPSLNEGNPTVMFEALGVGLPFIGTKVGGIPEIITSEDYGLLCEPANPDDLAEKILIALEKKWDKEKIRRYARQFTWDNIAKQVLYVYIKVIENAKRRK